MKCMKASDLIQKFAMEEHPENGAYVECHYISEIEGRADSGSIYYYVAPGEKTEFHRIDCDEYWCYNAGATIELWVIDNNGMLQKKLLGITDGAEPMVFFRRGEIFASRLSKDSDDGTFVTCVTVPRFTYDGFELFEKEKMVEMYPEAAGFWEND